VRPIAPSPVGALTLRGLTIGTGRAADPLADPLAGRVDVELDAAGTVPDVVAPAGLQVVTRPTW
jgi:hypothetical protein